MSAASSLPPGNRSASAVDEASFVYIVWLIACKERNELLIPCASSPAATVCTVNVIRDWASCPWWAPLSGSCACPAQRGTVGVQVRSCLTHDFFLHADLGYKEWFPPPFKTRLETHVARKVHVTTATKKLLTNILSNNILTCCCCWNRERSHKSCPLLSGPCHFSPLRPISSLCSHVTSMLIGRYWSLKAN